MERKARLEDGFASMRPIVSLSLFYVLFLSMESLLGERAATFCRLTRWPLPSPWLQPRAWLAFCCMPSSGCACRGLRR